MIDTMKLTWPWLVLGIFILKFDGSCGTELDYTVEISAGKMQCFFQNVTEAKYNYMEVDFQVIDGGDLNVNFLVSNPHNQVVVQDIRKTDGSHRVDVSQIKGDYQLCFDNTFSYQQHKVVFFELFIFDADGNLDELDFEALAQAAGVETDIGVTLTDFQAQTNRIKVNMNRAEHMQALLRAFEARDMSIMQANLNRVTFWSLTNGAVMVVVMLVQVYMIRSLFEDNSRMGKVLRKT